MATERVTERSDGVTSERTVERTPETRVVERRGGGGAGWIVALVAVVAIAAIALFLLTRQTPGDAAVEDAAQSVGAAAEQVGDAAQKAADQVAPN